MGKEGTYETFDSGSGPIQKSDAGSFEHMDKEDAYGVAGKVEQGAVPEVPAKKE